MGGVRDEAMLVGVDGGATSVRAHVVAEQGGLLVEVGFAASLDHADLRPAGVAPFEPVALAVQREEHARAAVQPTPEEDAESARRARGVARVVAEALRAASGRAGPWRARVGLCWPGLKDAAGAGVLVAKNGPRAPRLLADVAEALRAAGVELAAPLPPLMSDGLACGLGERHATTGALRGVDHGWYFGGGTGLAEAALVDGRVLALDQLGPGWKRAWELSSRAFGAGFEELVSAGGIDAAWRRQGGEGHAVDAALAGHAGARELLRRAAAALAELAVERILALHAQRGLVLQRIVVGQRLGEWCADTRLDDCCAAVLRAELAARLSQEAPDGVLRQWLPGGERPDRVVASTLRAAPALGAASPWLMAQAEEALARA
jgi:hypothetical protein